MQRAPTPRQARAALSEARRRERVVRGADRRFRPILLVLAAAVVAVGVLLGFYPRGGWRYEGLALLAISVFTVVAIGVLLRGGGVRSRGAAARFNLVVAAYSLWNGAVITASIASGWWTAGAPGFHATASFAVSALPLAVGAWLAAPIRR